MKQQFIISGMTCTACASHVERAAARLDGMQNVSVNLLASSMAAEYDPELLTPDDIVHAVETAGYGAALPRAETSKRQDVEEQEALEYRSMKRRVILSFCFLLPLFYLAMGHMASFPLPAFFHGTEHALSFGSVQLVFTLPIVLVNFSYYRNGVRTLLHGAPNMDTLIAIGSAAAVLYGLFSLVQIGIGLRTGDMALAESYAMNLYFESAGMILTLVTLGKFLESRSRGKTRTSISRLLDLKPKTASVLRDGKEYMVPVEEVSAGEILVVRPGQSIPVDGVITEGTSAVDESALTGESIPSEKKPGDKVFAATINRSGAFRFQALQVGDDTTLAQIIRLVEEAGSSKAPISRMADRIAAVFVPIVIGISLLAALVWLLLGYTFSFALSICISVLVVSCPCALGLATPVAIMVGSGKGAEYGILFKSARALESIHKVDTIVMDKTGTITEGRPRVTDLLPAPGTEITELLTIAASLEYSSEHPLARAVLTEAEARGISPLPAEQFEARSGQGVTALINGKSYLGGNRKLIADRSISTDYYNELSNSMEEAGKTLLYFAEEQRLLGVIAEFDLPKPGSATAIENFKARGIATVLLTGDNQRTAESVGRQLGISRVLAQVLPQEKEREIAALQSLGAHVAMVGDGINDAPALARADVGIAIGAGTDVAIESADVVLVRSDLQDVATAISLSKAVIRNIRQNLFWAFFYNVIGIPLAAGIFYPAFGLTLNPMFAAAAMSFSSVSVVGNALRLQRFRPPGGKRSTPVSSGIQTIQGKEGTNMKKTIVISGMSCKHCSAHVEQALGAIPGVSAQVNLAAQTATLDLAGPVSDEALTRAITEAGYQVISIS